MNDTSPKVERLLRQRFMARSGEERLAMGCAMFDDAKALVLAGLRAERPSMDDRECRVQLLRRLYGRGEDEPRFKRISARFGQV
jgi:hypothetical protein